MDQAQAYSALGDLDSATNLLSHIANTGKPYTRHDSVLIANSRSTELAVLCNKGLWEEADSVFSKMQSEVEYFPISVFSYYVKCLSLCYLGKSDSVPYYLQLGESSCSDLSDSCAMARARMIYAIQLGDYKSAYDLSASMYAITDTIMRKTLEGNAALAQRDFFQQRSENERVMAERRKTMIIGICILGSMLFIFSALYYGIRIRVKNAELRDVSNRINLIYNRMQDHIAENQALSKTIAEKDSLIDTLNSDNTYATLKNLALDIFIKDLKSISASCSIMYRVVEENEQRLLIRKMKAELERMRNTRNLTAVEDLVDKYHDNIMAEARKELHELGERSLNLLCLIYSGLDSDVICILLDMKPNSFGPTKSRLRSKIERCKSDRKDFFIKALNKES